MTPTTLALAPDPAPAAEVEPRFWGEVRGLTRRYVEMWWDTPCDFPELGEVVPRARQRRTAREARRLIDRLAREVAELPDGEAERAAWRERVQATLRRFGEEHLGWPEGYRELVCADEFFQATVDFARGVRAFDRGLPLADFGQALRNVWIMNSLQMLLDLPVASAPALFAYSMLYPLTDNLLDDPEVAPEAKREFNRRLGARLAGERVEARGRREAAVFGMVERIEGQYPRPRFPEVFSSLLAIHRAQVLSLTQQGRSQPPYESDLLAISVEKGGTSVLADGYLAAGTLAPGEADFCFGYGVFLQLLDDLQDVRRDREAGHMTVFSQTAGAWPLDRLASRLHRFTARTLAEASRFAAPRYDQLKDLIRRNSTGLLVASIADHQDLFTPAYVRELEGRWPVRFAALRRLRERARKRFEKASQVLCRRRGAASVLDLLAEAARV